MRKTKILLVLLLALLPFIGQAQKNYEGQHVSFKLTTGDSIQYDLRLANAGFKPVVQNGQIVWQSQGGYFGDFSIGNVEEIDFRSFEFDEREARKALIEFYHAMDGDNWIHHENWCSDKPIWEWYGVNGCDDNNKGWEIPRVNGLYMPYNGLSGKLPECILRMGSIETIALQGNDIQGEIPSSLGSLYSLGTLFLHDNKLTGTVPEEIGHIPTLALIYLSDNQLNGPLPEKALLKIMDKELGYQKVQIEFINNYFSGEVPEGIKSHPRFSNFWPWILRQNGGGMDLSSLTIPAPTFSIKDTNGNTIDLKEEYKKHKYTLLYKWRLGEPYSEMYNQLLVPAYKGYKDKGFEVIGFHNDLNYDDGLTDYLKTHDIPWVNTIRKDWGYTDFESYIPRGDVGIFDAYTNLDVFLIDQNGNIVFNSLMDEKGNNMQDTDYYYQLFNYLEEHLGPIDYNFYTSTDYSHDGEVTTLQTATAGQGIDLVFLGEGFTDIDIDNGTYDQRMTDALNQFFAYEPYTSLRDRFNVYVVKAVSPNAEFFGGNSVHAINENVSKALEYASKVTTLIPDRPMHVVVVYNNAGGRSYCVMMEDNSFVCYAMDGVSTLLNHEAGGHGIGKLFDEYVEDDDQHWASIPDDQKTELDNVWTTLGWGANVDWRSNPAEIKWAKFINDARYADERIGTYEGSYLYQYGAYRPTENSMMRYNNIGFNAPSREEIYKRVMKESEGDSWTYDYETFVAFDAAGHQQFVDALNTNRARKITDTKKDRKLLTAPPVFLKGTWRDALKKNKK